MLEKFLKSKVFILSMLAASVGSDVSGMDKMSVGFSSASNTKFEAIPHRFEVYQQLHGEQNSNCVARDGSSGTNSSAVAARSVKRRGRHTSLPKIVTTRPFTVPGWKDSRIRVFLKSKEISIKPYLIRLIMYLNNSDIDLPRFKIGRAQRRNSRGIKMYLKSHQKLIIRYISQHPEICKIVKGNEVIPNFFPSEEILP